MSERREEIVLCVGLTDHHLSDCVIVKCFKCSKALWISPHHVQAQRKAICMICVQVVKDDMEIGILGTDIKRAINEIEREKK